MQWVRRYTRLINSTSPLLASRSIQRSDENLCICEGRARGLNGSLLLP
ncbi:hypothetical protein [Azospirillum argentinense]